MCKNILNLTLTFIFCVFTISLLSSSVSAVDVTTDVKVNDSVGPVTVQEGDNIKVTIALNPGNQAGEVADWWLIVNTPTGEWEYFDLTSGAYTPGLLPTIQGFSLIDLAPTVILSTSDLGAGTYTYYFAIDLDQDGELDTTEGLFYYDSVEVTIR